MKFGMSQGQKKYSDNEQKVSQVRYWYKTNETRSIWVDACSVAGLITSAEVAIAYFEKPKKFSAKS